ncbi:MAG: UDP-glucose 4-epimerase GalE [Parachlamydiaceae bacterium]|nr:UDP-glucose 4-epimerase GalE [Parachlamydiaceae bacterium]
MKTKKILIVGGAGFIGSHVTQMLQQSGYETVVLDNLSRGSRKAVQQGTFIEGCISDRKLLDHLFSSHHTDAVMHFAALTDVGESVRDPLKYFIHNVSYTLNLLEAMKAHHIKTFIFSSSAAIFGVPKQTQVAEDHSCDPINPYGHSKLMVEQILRDADAAYDLRFCCLRYFNAAGGDPRGLIKYKVRPETNIIPIILGQLQQAAGNVKINGTDYPTSDGTCVRDYIHIEDLGRAHIVALEQLFAGASSNCYNLGNGNGFSVRQVVAAVEAVTGRKLHVTEGPRRPGDPAILVADAQRAHRELHWKPQYPHLETMIEHAWRARIT